MAYKSVMTVWDGRNREKSVLELACKMTSRENGHLSILCLGFDRTSPGLYYAGASPFAMNESLEMARNNADAYKAEVEDFMSTREMNWSCQKIIAQIGGIPHMVGRAARFNDLVVLPQPYGGNQSEEAVATLEAALFDGHTPVLVCPTEKSSTPGKKVVVAWNESAEAMAAIKAGLPFIRNADAVDIAIVEPGPRDETVSEPGHHLSQMLVRHGAKVNVSILAKSSSHVATTLLQHARDIDADMIVMGAYGHSRFRQSIIGGATRDMLKDIQIPVFMAH